MNGIQRFEGSWGRTDLQTMSHHRRQDTEEPLTLGPYSYSYGFERVRTVQQLYRKRSSALPQQYHSAPVP